MLFMLDEIMTPSEACNRWGITQDDGLVNKLIEEGKLKYYKPEEKLRGEWILTIEAMNILFPKNA